ncbi:serine/threonine-protein kinase [Streptomyces brasiliscabiei]|uniref:serine/threonine-protein kinase n=1 Tax=Streptomyces brasiliscabiei TaxID=2736302 RepID=UPI00301523BB
MRDDDPTSVGEYVLEDRLGSGGMGIVYRARSASGRLVALKLVHAQYCDDDEFRSRFRQEIAAARRVSGAFTTPVVDADPEAKRPWMATLYVPGPTLFDLVGEEGPLSTARIRGLALGLVEALRDIHRAGVVHRDLKPANVLMAEDGPRVIDFGISRAGDNLPLTVTGRVIGTPPFMSPEQLRSPRDVTAASDVFSLGSLLVFAASGHSPFKAESPYLAGYQVMFEAPKLHAVPEPLRRLAERCLEKDPAARPDLAELHRLLLELPTSPDTARLATDPAPEPLDRPTDARPTVTGTAVTGPTDTGRADDATANDSAADSHPVDRPPAQRRAFRRRLILAGLGATLTVTALGAALLGYAGFEDSATSSGAETDVDYRSVSLPEGWRPWRTPLRADSGLPADYIPVNYNESGCRTDG